MHYYIFTVLGFITLAAMCCYEKVNERRQIDQQSKRQSSYAYVKQDSLASNWNASCVVFCNSGLLLHLIISVLSTLTNRYAKNKCKKGNWLVTTKDHTANQVTNTWRFCSSSCVLEILKQEIFYSCQRLNNDLFELFASQEELVYFTMKHNATHQCVVK